MQRITQVLEDHHALCDDAFASAEAAVVKKQWDQASELLDTFLSMMKTHFHTEETQLFPAFEAATGNDGGPTSVMRHEHVQMRELFNAMAEAVLRHDADDFAGTADTLVILMEQHNLKEENILYPMCDSMEMENAVEFSERLRHEIESATT